MQTLSTIVIVAAVLWFALTNAGAVTLTILVWDVSASLALVVGVSFLLGFLLGLVRLFPSFWRYRSQSRAVERSRGEVQKERDILSEQVTVLKEQVSSLAPPAKKEDA